MTSARERSRGMGPALLCLAVLAALGLIAGGARGARAQSAIRTGAWSEKFSSGRADAATALDPIGRRWIASGGINPYGKRTVLEVDLDAATPIWRSVPLGGGVTPPGLRILSSLVFDSRRGRYLDFGGSRPDDDGSNEVWSFEPGANPHWTLLTTDGERIPSPGTLDPDEMDPFWGEGDVSAVDQLNRLATRLRRSMTSGSPPRAERHAATPEAAQDPGEGLSPGARRLRSLSEG